MYIHLYKWFGKQNKTKIINRCAVSNIFKQQSGKLVDNRTSCIAGLPSIYFCALPDFCPVLIAFCKGINKLPAVTIVWHVEKWSCSPLEFNCNDDCNIFDPLRVFECTQLPWINRQTRRSMWHYITVLYTKYTSLTINAAFGREI